MKKIVILVTVMMIFGVTLSFGEEYKSMCELHPEECAYSGLGKLGEVVKSKDSSREYRVITEAKSATNPVWFQFVDVKLVGDEFDGECNFAVFFVLKEDGFYGQTFSCEKATAIIKSICATTGIEYDDYVHKAK